VTFVWYMYWGLRLDMQPMENVHKREVSFEKIHDKNNQS